MLSQLLDRVAAVIQQAFIPIDVSDLGAARGRGQEARIVSEDAVLAELANIDDVGAKIARNDRQIDWRGAVIECQSDFSRFHNVIVCF